MESLKNFKDEGLFQVLNMRDEDFENWLKSMKLLHQARICECGLEMKYKWKKDREQPLWSCYSKANHGEKQPTCGFYSGTFFANAHLSPKQVLKISFNFIFKFSKQIFRLSYYWARNMYTQDEIEFQTGIQHAIVNWKNFFRDLCCEWYTKNTTIIGKNTILQR